MCPRHAKNYLAKTECSVFGKKCNFFMPAYHGLLYTFCVERKENRETRIGRSHQRNKRPAAHAIRIECQKVRIRQMFQMCANSKYITSQDIIFSNY